uniref:Adhesion G-protein coupled receptor G2 n=1 Tax=Sinocyclocheilus anshuiensis TaxID=1608454 RepID=A0A671R5D2_9TELE
MTSVVTTTHTTLDVTAQPVNTADTTEKITTSVVSTTHTTLNVTTQPVDTTDKITTSMVSTKHTTLNVVPHNITTSHVSTTATSNNIENSPVKTTGTESTLNITTSNAHTTGTPHNLAISTAGISNNKTTSPVSTTDTTHNITTSPVSTTGTSNNIPTSPVSTTNMTHNIIIPPVSATGATHNTTTSPVSTTDTTHNITTSSVSTTGTSNNIPTSPISTTNLTHNIIIPPVSATGTPYNTTTSPVSTTETTLNLTTSLIHTTDTTLNEASPLVSTAGTPHNTTTTMVSTTDTAHSITPSLVHTIDPTHNITAKITETTFDITNSPASTRDTTLDVTASLVHTISTPHNITTSPVKTTETTINTTTTPHNVPPLPISATNTTPKITTASVSTTGTPIITTSLVSTTDIALNVTTPPVNTTVTVQNLTYSPVNTTVIPLNLTVTRLSSTTPIVTVDNLGMKLVIRDQTENIVFDSLALTVTKVDGTNFGKTSFTIADPLNPQVTKGLQRQVRAVESSSPLAKITLPASLTENLSPEEKKMASRVQFTFFQKSTFFRDKTLSPEKLNSHILGSSVANLSIKNLRENVTFTLRNKQPGNYVASCVFWDFDQNGGLGGWNGNGCSVKNSSTENETVCSCNHLTSFAVLLVCISDSLHAIILTFITYIGCGVSAIFLSVTLITYLAFEKLRRDIPSKILIHLSFGLLLLNLVFLLDSWLALYKDAVGLCISAAFFLHYFLLVSFTWMGLEALHMYLAIVKVFNNFMSRYMLKFSLAGWGIPLVVVIIVIAVNKDNYGLVSYGKFSDGTTDEFCWLNNNIAFYVAVVAYFCVIFVLNLAMFVVVMIHLRRIKRRNPHNNQYRSGLHDLRSIAGLTFLLGLTWGFAFFAWRPVNLAFTYLFAIFNSLQGFFIFVFHCALKENVRKQWRMYLCCGSLRLAENSGTATLLTNTNSCMLPLIDIL